MPALPIRRKDTTMKPTCTHTLIALAASFAFLAAGCGSSGGGSTTTSSSTSASATDTWASGVCSSITTWQAAIKSAAGSVKSDPTKNGLQTAAGDAKAATETLATDLKGQGKPDTQGGQQAKDSLDQLSTTLQQGMTTIENTVKGISGLKGALTAVPAVTGTLATMEKQIKTTFTSLQGLGANGELKSAFASSSACNSLTSSGS